MLTRLGAENQDGRILLACLDLSLRSPEVTSGIKSQRSAEAEPAPVELGHK